MKNLPGLSEKETRVYMAILGGGKLSQTDIATQTELNRTSLYPILKSLLLKDFISKTLRGKRAIYYCNNPEKILRNASTAIASFESLLPSLLETYKTKSNKPNIIFHDGADGIFKATLKGAEEGFFIKSFSSPKNFLGVLNRRDAKKIITAIEKNEVKIMTLTSHDEDNLKLVKTFPSPNLEWRAMPKGISYPVEFFLYNNTTVITSWQHRFAVEIISEDITKFMVQLFDYFWKVGSKS